MRHRFAAILAADVAHFSALMEDDGEGTVRALKDCRSIFRRYVSEHHGREFGSVGDSLMAEFPSPVEAIRAARDIQSALLQEIPSLNNDEHLQVRIGLHAGDVISDDDNLFGDVVNTAARLQEIAKPGGITLSALVHAHVKNERDFEFRLLGQQTLKNILEPIKVYEVERQHRALNWRRLRLTFLPYKTAIATTIGVLIASVLFAMYLENRQPGIGGVIEVSAAARSIAVLPFQNRSPMAEDAVFVDGMHADILTQLAKLRGLDKVISQTSVERYRNTDKSIILIARELAVANILEGTVQSAGDQMRINLQLIDGLTDDHRWAKTYELDLTAQDLFATQRNIARDVARELNVVLTDAEQERLQTKPTTNLDAYGEFVLGHAQMSMRNKEEVIRAQAHFEKAIELDPDYALAYVGLADSLALLGYGSSNFEDSAARRQTAIDKALELDPLSGEAYASLARLKWSQLLAGEFDLVEVDRRADEAESFFLKALELSPNYATAHKMYAWTVLRGATRYEEALVHLRRAIELDPMVPVYTANLAGMLWRLGRVEEAQAVLLKGVERNPRFAGHYGTMTQQLQALGQLGKAVQWLHAGTRLAPSIFSLRINECLAYLGLGDDQSAERCLDIAEEDFPERAVDWRIDLYEFRSQPQEVARLLQQLSLRKLSSFMRGRLAWSYINNEEADKARVILQDQWPELYGSEDVIINPWEWHLPIMVAYTLYVDGELDRANYLFDTLLERMQSMHRTRGWGFGAWDAVIHAVRGDKQKAFSALREAIDMGWRQDWWWVLRSPFFKAMQDDPEWIALMSELEADIARQRQWYEEHRDDPLF